MNTPALVGIIVALGGPVVGLAIGCAPAASSSPLKQARRLGLGAAIGFGGAFLGLGTIIAAANPFVPQQPPAHTVNAKPPLFPASKL